MTETSEPTVEDDRPYLRPEPSSLPWVLGVLALLIVAGVGYYFHSRPPVAEVRTAAAPKAEPQPQAAPAPTILNPLPPVESNSLPTLENSDSMMREAIAVLVGRQAFNQLVVADRLIPRIVATVDSLPRRTAPQRMMPLHAVPGAFRASSGEPMLDPSNASRYAAYVHLLDAVPSPALVALYVKTYPLFQRAYEQLGFGGKYFNDRVVETIDDLLAAPEVGAPVALVRPKVLYEFADPELETRSAGQKILIRMGSTNARKVKAWLRGLRQEIVAAGVQR